MTCLEMHFGTEGFLDLFLSVKSKPELNSIWISPATAKLSSDLLSTLKLYYSFSLKAKHT